MAFYCYMVRCTNDAFYTGWTTDPLRSRPVRLVYVEEVEDHSAALKREAEIKGFTHARKALLADSAPLPAGFDPDG